MRYVIALLLSLSFAQAQNFAVRLLWMDARHEFNTPSGCPTNWPVAVDNIGTNTVSPYPNRLVLTEAQLNGYYTTNRIPFQNWYSTVYTPTQTAKSEQDRVDREAIETELRNTLGQLKTAFQNWNTLTAGQKDAAQRLNIRATVLLAMLQKFEN